MTFAFGCGSGETGHELVPGSMARSTDGLNRATRHGEYNEQFPHHPARRQSKIGFIQGHIGEEPRLGMAVTLCTEDLSLAVAVIALPPLLLTCRG